MILPNESWAKFLIRQMMLLRHIKLFPQCDEHLFFSVLGVRNHLPHVMRMLSVTNFQNGGQVKEGN